MERVLEGWSGLNIIAAADCVEITKEFPEAVESGVELDLDNKEAFAKFSRASTVQN